MAQENELKRVSKGQFQYWGESCIDELHEEMLGLSNELKELIKKHELVINIQEEFNNLEVPELANWYNYNTECNCWCCY